MPNPITVCRGSIQISEVVDGAALTGENLPPSIVIRREDVADVYAALGEFMAQTRGEDDADARLLTLAEVKRRYIQQVLDGVDGNKSRAAHILGVHRRSLYRIK